MSSGKEPFLSVPRDSLEVLLHLAYYQKNTALHYIPTMMDRRGVMTYTEAHLIDVPVDLLDVLVHLTEGKWPDEMQDFVGEYWLSLLRAWREGYQGKKGEVQS